MLVAITMLAFSWLGYEIAIRRWRGRAGPLEIWSAALCIGAALWMATVWLLALLDLLERPAMLVRTFLAVVAAAGAFLSRTKGRLEQPGLERNAALVYVLPSLPLLAWLAYILWRTSFLPPLTHDALAYHLPRAVLWIRAQGYAFLNLPIDPRMRLLPANYELLAADVMLLGRGDALTEWIAVFFYIAFVIACGALAQRWWDGRGLAVFVTMLLSAAVPVLLLHTGADKNDVMVAFFIVTALLWGGRWFNGGEIDSLAICLVAIIAAIGTKPQGLMVALCLAPLLLWRLQRERRERRVSAAAIAGLLMLSIAAATLLGGAFYVSRLFEASPSSSAERNDFVAYDDWENLWQGPWVLLTAPFARESAGLYVPWADTPLFWHRGEIYFSHLGIPFALCAVAAPFAWARFRRDATARASERHAIAAAAFGVLLLMLPIRDVPMPHGIYIAALPRYVLFIVPVVFALTITPVVNRFFAVHPRHAFVLITTATMWFILEATIAVMNDRFVPLDYVRWARAHRGRRVIPFDQSRAASVADTASKENEKFALDAGYGAWIHPAFGPSLRRPVTFIETDSDPPLIPDDVVWVVIDRSWRIIWQHPDFHDATQFPRYLGKGSPAPEDTRLFRYLLRDKRFTLVYYHGPRNQAIFRRIR